MRKYTQYSIIPKVPPPHTKKISARETSLSGEIRNFIPQRIVCRTIAADTKHPATAFVTGIHMIYIQTFAL